MCPLACRWALSGLVMAVQTTDVKSARPVTVTYQLLLWKVVATKENSARPYQCVYLWTHLQPDFHRVHGSRLQQKVLQNQLDQYAII